MVVKVFGGEGGCNIAYDAEGSGGGGIVRM